jgi:hypothetical protein
MDMSLVAAIMSMKAGALQQRVATSTLKSNLDTQKSSVLTLLGAAQQTLSLANVGNGVGGSMNVTA